jgi:hypothetical protein
MSTEVEAAVEKTMKENYDALKATIEALTLDYEKFNDKKVKAAGARVRNNLLNCKKLCDKLRKQVLVDITALPIKHRKGCSRMHPSLWMDPQAKPQTEDEKVEVNETPLRIEIPEEPRVILHPVATPVDASANESTNNATQKPPRADASARRPRKANKKTVRPPPVDASTDITANSQN